MNPSDQEKTTSASPAITKRRKPPRPLSGVLADIERILLQDWDPIGVANEPKAVREYEYYVLDIHDLLAAHASADQIAAHLKWIETTKMSVRGNRDEHLLDVAQTLKNSFHDASS